MMAARRAMWRWSWRQLRQEWRQQILILGLVSFAAGAAAFFATMIFYANQPASVYTGSATHRLTVFESDATLDETLRVIETTVGMVEVTGVRDARRDQSTITFEMIDPPTVSAFGAEPIRLRSGRPPASRGEIALSPELANQLGAVVGDEIPIDGTTYTVVGLAENPANLGQPLAVVAEGTLDDPTRLSVLITSSSSEFELLTAVPAIGVEWLGIGERAQLVAVTAIVALTAVGMIEVALMCSAGFAVVGQRRLRQLGILSSVGATSRQRSCALKINGLVTGIAGGSVGVFVGFVASLAVQPVLENAIGWRVATWSIPWVVALPLVGLAGLAGLGAAWWPARSLARVPIVDALASRRPSSRSRAGQWAILGATGFLIGAGALGAGVSRGIGGLAVIGLVVAILGLLLITPVVVAAAGSLAPRMPLAQRLALRTISRNPGRSSATLAALVVALGIPAAVALTSGAADARLQNGPPNLPDNWLTVWPGNARFGDVPTSFDAAALAENIKMLSRAVAGARVTPIMMVEAPDDGSTIRVGEPVVNVVRVARIIEDNGRGDVSYVDDPVWIATPELLAAVGADPLLTNRMGLLGTSGGEVFRTPFEFESSGGQQPGPLSGGVTPTPLGIDAYRGIGSYWMSIDQVEREGGRPIVAGWLITKSTALTSQDLQAAYRLVDPSLNVESQRPDQTSTGLRRITLAVGVVSALAVLAVAVSLLRVESMAEEQTLSALGARPRTQRQITAATTGFLALGAAALAIPAGYLALFAMASDPGADYPLVFPIDSLGTLAIGVPLIGAAGAYGVTRSSPRRIASGG